MRFFLFINRSFGKINETACPLEPLMHAFQFYFVVLYKLTLNTNNFITHWGKLYLYHYYFTSLLKKCRYINETKNESDLIGGKSLQFLRRLQSLMVNQAEDGSVYRVEAKWISLVATRFMRVLRMLHVREVSRD